MPPRPAVFDGRREPGDDTVAPHAPDAVRGGVRAESHRGAEIPEGQAPVAHERAEDLAVDRIHAAIVAVRTGRCSTKRRHRRYDTAMLEPLAAGLLAGWGVAIPLGAIGVMVVDLGMRSGLRPAAAAAAGVATADFLYAALAAAAGAAVAGA